MRQTARESKEREAQWLREKAECKRQLLEAREQIVESLGLGQPEDYPLAILPANTLPLAPLPQERKDQLAENLRAVILRVLADPTRADGRESPSNGGRSAPGEETLPGELAILGNACATCRGWCCQGGGEHAYLDEVSIGAYLADYPSKDADEILADYLSYIPAVSYEGSCIYHADSGCTLPRDMRSEVARLHYCQGLKEFRQEMPMDGPPVGLAAAIENGEIVRMAIIDKVQARPIGGLGQP